MRLPGVSNIADNRQSHSGNEIFSSQVLKLEGNLPTGSTAGPPLTILPAPPPGALSSLLWSLALAECAEGVAATARETPTPAARPDAALGSPEPSACED